MIALAEPLVRAGRRFVGWLDGGVRARQAGDVLAPERYHPRRQTDPLGQWLPWIAYDDQTGLFLLEDAQPGQIGAFGFAIELAPQTGANEQMWSMFQTLFTMAPRPGMSLQMQLYASPRFEPFLEAFRRTGQGRIARNEAEAQGLAMMRQATERRVAYLRHGATNQTVGSIPYRFRNFRLMFSVTLPADGLKDQDSLRAAASFRELCARTFQSFWMFSHHVTPVELIGWCAEILNPVQAWQGALPDLAYNPLEEIRDQVLLPDSVLQVRRERIDATASGPPIAIRAMTAARFPDELTLATMARAIGDPLQRMTGYPCPFLISYGARTLDYAKVQHEVSLRAARAAQAVETPMARFMPEWRHKHESWQVMQEAFNDNKGATEMMLDVLVFDTDRIDDAAQAAQNVWRSARFELVSNDTAHVTSLITGLPMTLTRGLQEPLRKRKRLRRVTVYNAVDMIPALAEWTGFGAPLLATFGRCGQAQGIDLFAPQAANYNAAIAAESGKGKSVLANELAAREWQRGTKVFVIDIGRNYERLCRNVGGQYIQFTRDAGISLNPFSMVTSIDEDIPLLKPLFAQMASPSRPLDDYETTQLGIILRQCWDDAAGKGRLPTITDVAEALKQACAHGGINLDGEQCDPRLRDLGVQLFEYTEDGAYGHFFSGQANIDFTSDFVVLELEELRPWKDLQSVVLLILMQRIARDAYFSRHQRKLILIDEAWALLEGDNSAPFIEEGYRRIRRYNGGFVTITQNIRDYFKSAATRAAYFCAAWRITLFQKPESIAGMIQAGEIVLEDAERKAMESLETVPGLYSELLVKCGTDYGIARMILDPYSLLLYSSAPADYNAIEAYRAQGLSPHEAILRVMADRGLDPEGPPQRQTA